ncbi:gamma-glutamyl-gamma-aminobutyrate hydrolase family protein [Halobacillus mangrovi]|uniref:gamma-glutamyl-gamma-aminobutyrate hydrolase family protein n=1 Tax=Halobacillus mangrovi TaxID=402384 RepID=UPI0018DEB6BB|nr:gamma-glutamyl-gamma-aminobutyrate hydrolase family protein [Halobacillus mangrovi]
MKPWIGITVHVDDGKSDDLYPQHPLMYIESDYIKAIEVHGMHPILLPVLDDTSEIESYLSKLDGLLVTGGGYLNLDKPLPSSPDLSGTGDTRYSFEFVLLQQALNAGLPILGVCRGMQMLNEVHGGTLENLCSDHHHQEVLGIESDILTHSIELKKESKLSEILGSDYIDVNSRHRQKIFSLGNGLREVGWSSKDRVIEAIESENKSWVFGLQFHPEQLYKRDPRWSSLFNDLKRAAKQYSQTKLKKEKVY